jgi:hypothetical protein
MTYIHTHVRTYIHNYIHTYIQAHIHSYVHTYVHTYIHTYKHTYIHTYVHTYKRTYIHTYEIGNSIDGINCKKAPGVDGITGEKFQRAYKQFPELITTLYNECLRQGCFPKRWKRVKLIPLTKPGKEDATDPSKFRPTRLINIGGKVLE